MVVLITGITGFVGSHLAEYILSLNEGHKVYGLCRWRSNKENIKHIINEINLVEGDLLDLSSMRSILDEIQPTYIFHLAAQSYVVTSFKSPAHTLTTNIIGTSNLLEAVRMLNSEYEYDPIIHICSSSEVYGQVEPYNVPIKEDCPFAPASPYAVSKVGEDMVALQYWLSYKVKTIRTRMFTHTGPRRGEVFAISAFAKRIAAIELGLAKNMVVGNLRSVRTFCDVRDAVRAYWLLVNKCNPGEVYNIGGVETMTIGKALDVLVNLSTSEIHVEVDERLLRPSDVTLQIPSIAKFVSETGWAPIIPFTQTCVDTLNYWRNELKQNPWKVKSLEY